MTIFTKALMPEQSQPGFKEAIQSLFSDLRSEKPGEIELEIPRNLL